MIRELSHKNEIPTEDEETSTYMYLFVIVLAMFMAINSMANNWEKDIMGSITVQITPVEDENKHIDKDKTQEEINKVLQFMENVSGVKQVSILDNATIEKLMTPWLGNKVDITALPIPHLLDVQVKDNADINYDEVTRGLHKITENASIDNHRLWLNKLIKFANSLKTLALSVLLMVGIIGSFSIYYSARTSLGINIASIEILHIIGAQDEYIAKQYAKIYGKIGFFAGIIGLMIAVPCIILIGRYGMSTGSGLLNGAQLSTLNWFVVMSTPLFSFLYAMITAYYTVLKSLEKMC